MNVYFAGRIRFNDWRHRFFPELRGASIERGRDGDLSVWMGDRWPEHRHLAYVGPFFVSCDHGCYHASGAWDLPTGNPHDPETFEGYGSRHGATNGCMGRIVTRRQVVELCRQWIERCDVVFAWVEDTEAFGTYAEIGYAAALGKPIWLYELPALTDEMWFLRELATEHRTAMSPEDAVRDFIRSTANPTLNERAFCDEIELAMERHDWTVQREVAVPGGRIDVLASRYGRERVIEAKLLANQRTVREALGQLLVYGHYRTKAELFFASPEQPSNELTLFLGEHGIRVFDFGAHAL